MNRPPYYSVNPLLAFMLTSLLLCSPAFANEAEIVQPLPDDVRTQFGVRKTVLSESEKTGMVPICLSGSHFDPLKLIPPASAQYPSLKTNAKGVNGYYLLQFTGPIQDSWKTDLSRSGVTFFDYIPDFTYIVRMDSGLESTVRKHSHVRWLGIYQPAYRISQDAGDTILTGSPKADDGTAKPVMLHVTVFPGETVSRVRSDLTAAGAVILDAASSAWKTSLKVSVAAKDIAALAAVRGVKHIEIAPKWKLFNNKANDIMGIRPVRTSCGLYGEGQTVGICDSGLDKGDVTPTNLHDDFEDGHGNSRVLQIIDRVGDSAQDRSGHGTHVAGSVLGNGANSGSTPAADIFPETSFTGSAPKANLIFQAIEDEIHQTLSGIPLDLNELFEEADTAGADLHTNSWGEVQGGRYTIESRAVDLYIWNHKDFLILFAAGNEGIDKDADGVIDPYSIISPATAKNCLSVGASENLRPSGEGNDDLWGGTWPRDYSADPVKSDHISNNISGMAAFSSRGPALDGRYKPDVVAPGTNILSTKSSVTESDGWGPYNDFYQYMGGTSMATPLVAGAAAVMREFLIKKGYSTPSAALLKAALLNSSKDIAPGQYGTGETQEIPNSPVPNPVEGWGRVDVAAAVTPAADKKIQYIDEITGLTTGASNQYSVNVTETDRSLKINLVWTDYPGTPVAAGGLVNDLDLMVTTPSAERIYADQASQKSRLTTLCYDRDSPNSTFRDNKTAIRFTPNTYPAKVESTTFLFYNSSSGSDTVDIVLYDDDGDSDDLPGSELFRKTLSYVPTGWITVGIDNVTIHAGDFFIAVEKTNYYHQELFVDKEENPENRSLWYDAGAGSWKPSAHTV